MTNQELSYLFPGNRKLTIVQGDITQESTDAIVNAANEKLRHGGGVAAAIARAGGPEIQHESNEWVATHGPVSHEQPAITTSGKMPSKYVIHAVGPVWGSGDEPRKLADSIYGSLRLASEKQFKSIAFPAISTGIFGYPKEDAAPVFFETIARFIAETPDNSLELIKITIIDLPTLTVFQEAFLTWMQTLAV
jgi:O-acetyl-ADP-ribose deacetylase (regulator of RNase III)